MYSSSSSSEEGIRRQLKSSPTARGDPDFPLTHVDVEAQLPQAQRRVQLALGDFDDELRVVKIFPHPYTQDKASVLSLF